MPDIIASCHWLSFIFFANPFFLTFIQILSKSLFTHPCYSNACSSGYGLGYNGQPCRLWSYVFLHKYCILSFPFFSVYLMCKKLFAFRVVRIRMNIGHVVGHNVGHQKRVKNSKESSIKLYKITSIPCPIWKKRKACLTFKQPK